MPSPWQRRSRQDPNGRGICWSSGRTIPEVPQQSHTRQEPWSADMESPKWHSHFSFHKQYPGVCPARNGLWYRKGLQQESRKPARCSRFIPAAPDRSFSYDDTWLGYINGPRRRVCSPYSFWNVCEAIKICENPRAEKNPLLSKIGPSIWSRHGLRFVKGCDEQTNQNNYTSKPWIPWWQESSSYYTIVSGERPGPGKVQDQTGRGLRHCPRGGFLRHTKTGVRVNQSGFASIRAILRVFHMILTSFSHNNHIWNQYF